MHITSNHHFFKVFLRGEVAIRWWVDTPHGPHGLRSCRVHGDDGMGFVVATRATEEASFWDFSMGFLMWYVAHGMCFMRYSDLFHGTFFIQSICIPWDIEWDIYPIFIRWDIEWDILMDIESIICKYLEIAMIMNFPAMGLWRVYLSHWTSWYCLSSSHPTYIEQWTIQ